MTYDYRVTLAGLKGFFRLYRVNGTTTLYSLHKQMRADMEFAPDQQILFKALGENGTVIARYALIDLGAGAVDNVTIADTIKAGVKSFVYFYDIQSKKSVIVTLESEAQGSVLSPVIIESKGPNPIEFENGYVAFEDLPEDKRRLPGQSKAGKGEENDDDDEDFDDEDDDEEEDDKEKEDIIYDENE